MSDGRGMPLLSGPPPEYTASEPACRKCNKEFNMLFTRSRRCNHCGTCGVAICVASWYSEKLIAVVHVPGYSYCHSCTDFQALMPRRESSDLGAVSGYDPMPVCAFCIEMLQSMSPIVHRRVSGG